MLAIKTGTIDNNLRFTKDLQVHTSITNFP